MVLVVAGVMLAQAPYRAQQVITRFLDGLAWLAQMPRQPRTVFVVHGEASGSAELARRIGDELGWLAVVPRLGERVRLD